jgi:membrane protein YdbS with pleckstrin-like domain
MYPPSVPQPSTPPVPMMMSQPEVAVAVFRPSFIFVGVWYAIAMALTAAIVIVGAIIDAKIWSPLAPAVPWITAGLSLLMFVIPIWRHLRQWSETYTLTNQKIEIGSGIIWRTVRTIPLNKIQDVTLRLSLLQRLLGLGDLVIDSAAGTGRVFLRNVSEPQRMSSEILRLANQR